MICIIDWIKCLDEVEQYVGHPTHYEKTNDNGYILYGAQVVFEVVWLC